MQRKLPIVILSFGLVALLSASPVIALPIVTPIVQELGDGTFRYSYELLNPDTSTENLFDFGVFFQGDPFAVLAPGGWDSIYGLGFIDWFSTDPVSDLLAGSTLGGFSFESAFGPGTITFSSLGANSLTGDVGLTEYGETVGPVPEPATLLLLGAGLSGLLARRRWPTRR